jgi:hypothetical protein
MGTDTVIRLGELYAAHAGLELSTVSTYASNDGKWLPALQRGTAGCTVRRLVRVIAWFSENWPADLEWPRDIPRPSKPKEAA